MTLEKLQAIAKKLGVPVETLTKGNKALLDKYLAEHPA